MSLLIFLLAFSTISEQAGLHDLSKTEINIEIVSCVLNIINEYVNRRTVVFFSEEEQISELWTEIIRNMTKPFMVVSQQQLLQDTDLLLFVLFPKYNTNYSVILQKLKRDSLFILIASKWFSTVNLDNIFKQFYNIKMISYILLIPHSNRINIYTSFPYSKHHCGDNGPPTLIDYYVDGEFKKKINLFNTGKYFNMYGCTLTCLANGQPPDANIAMGKDGEVYFEGIAKELMSALSKQLNFKPEIILPYNSSLHRSWFFYNNTADHIKEYLKTDKVDFAIGVFSRLAFTDTAIIFGKETRYECYTWAVPSRAGNKRTVIMNYVQEFTMYFWMLFMASVVAGVFVIVAVTRITGKDKYLQSFLNAFIYLFATVVNQPFPVKPKPSSLRLFLAHWLAYVVVVTTAYQAALWSFMTIPWQVHNIDNLQDLLNSNLELGGPQQMLNVIKSMQSSNENIKKIIERFTVLPPSDFKDVIHRIKTKRNFAVFGEKSYLKTYSRDYNTVFETDNIHIMSNCQYQSVMTLLLFPSASPLSEPIGKILLLLLQNGLVGKISTQSEESLSKTFAINHQTSSYNIMTLTQCRGIFIILIFGYGISFVALLCEIVYSNVSKSPQQISINVLVGPKLYQRKI